MRFDPHGHGTEVASKAVGANLGVAKNANLVAVKIPASKYTLQVTMHYSHIIDGLSKIIDHISGNGLQGKAVVNLSFGKRSL